MENYLESCLDEIREQVGDARVLLGLSGGVDSSVCAALLARAVPGQLTCIYVDHGLMREGESRQVREAFRGMDLDLRCVDAGDRLLDRLAGVTEPEAKRKIIGRQFAQVFEEEARKLGRPAFLPKAPSIRTWWNRGPALR